MQGRLWITGALGGLPIFNGGMAHTIENGQASSLKLEEMRTAGSRGDSLPAGRQAWHLVIASVAKQSRVWGNFSGLLRAARDDNVEHFPTTFYVLRTTNCPPTVAFTPRGIQYGQLD